MKRKAALGLLLAFLIVVPVYMAWADKAAPIEDGDGFVIEKRRYKVELGENGVIEYLYFPKDGDNHMYWWDWAIRYNGQTHWSDEFNVLRHRARRSGAYWVLSNGEVMVKIRVIARTRNRIFIKYYIRALDRDVNDIVFYQGADFDIDDTADYDEAFYENGVVYAVGEEGTYIGFRFWRKPPTAWHVDFYDYMWDAIGEGELNNAFYYSGDIGVALAYDIGRRGRVNVLLGFGSDLTELSRALRTRLVGGVD